jgi:hypothetical protein
LILEILPILNLQKKLGMRQNAPPNSKKVAFKDSKLGEQKRAIAVLALVRYKNPTPNPLLACAEGAMMYLM